jgi:hypothetical protein
VLSTEFPEGFCEKRLCIPSLVGRGLFNLYHVAFSFFVWGKVLYPTQRAGAAFKKISSALYYSIVPSVWPGTVY